MHWTKGYSTEVLSHNVSSPPLTSRRQRFRDEDNKHWQNIPINYPLYNLLIWENNSPLFIFSLILQQYNSATLWDSPKENCYDALWKKNLNSTNINSNCIWSFDNDKLLHSTFSKPLTILHIFSLSNICLLHPYACRWDNLYIQIRFDYAQASFVLYVAPSFNNNIDKNKSKRRRKSSYLSKFWQVMLRNVAT